MTRTPQRELRDDTSETSEHEDVRVGSPLPMGTKERDGGLNFAIFSRYASRVRLEFFDLPDDAAPARTIDFDSTRSRTGDVWHIWVKGITSGQLYAYRVDGPYEPNKGDRFNFKKLLLDPFATAISHRPPWDFASALGYDPSSPGKDLTPSKLDSPSAFGGNPLLLSPDRLVDHGCLGRQDIDLPDSWGAGKVDYPGAADLKIRWLKKAFENFEKNSHGGATMT